MACRAAQDLEEALQAWRERPLGEQPSRYLYLDAPYEHVRVDGQKNLTLSIRLPLHRVLKPLRIQKAKPFHLQGLIRVCLGG